MGKGKGKNTESENKNRGKGDKSREKRGTIDWLAADGSQDRLQGANIEVRDRSGCPAPLDSHLHTHTFPVSSSLMFTVSISQHFIVTGAT